MGAASAVAVARVLYRLSKTHLPRATDALSQVDFSGSEAKLCSAVAVAYESLLRSTNELRAAHATAEDIKQFSRRARAVLRKKGGGLEGALVGVFRRRFEAFVREANSAGEAKGRREEGEKENDGFKKMCRRLLEMGYGSLVGEVVFAVVLEVVSKVVEEWGEEGGSVVARLEEWGELRVVRWMRELMGMMWDRSTCQKKGDPEDGLGWGFGVEGTGEGELELEQWRLRFRFHVWERLARVRIRRALDMVKNWPKSRSELADLKFCLERTDEKRNFADQLSKQLDIEVLHPGTTTSEIIQVYVSMIRSLRFVDPTGVLLEWVSGPVRDCLRSRADTVHYIVAGMTGDGDLYQELAEPEKSLSWRRSAKVYQVPNLIEEMSDEDDFDIDDSLIDWNAYTAWEPKPMDAPVGDRWNSERDAISLFASIYSTGEAIVNEYRASLAEKLVSNLDYDLEREEKILELLQARFGADTMHSCKIMLKDARDSLTILRSLKESLRTCSLSTAEKKMVGKFDALVLSRVFWPKSGKEPQFKLADELSKIAHYFGTFFERQNDPRKLSWLSGHGKVSLRMSFDDGRELRVQTTPFQASMLLKFAERSRWTLDELVETLKTEPKILKRNMNPWINQGVIREMEGGLYETVENASDADLLECKGDEDVDVEMSAGFHEEREKDGMAVFESYIVGMLQNLKAMPLEKIHNMLTIFVKTPVYDKTQEQLRKFLEQLITSGKIELESGQYMLAKKQ